MGVALSDGSFPHRTRPPFQIIQSSKSELGILSKDVRSQRPRGAIVARLTPDQKVRSSNLSAVTCCGYTSLDSFSAVGDMRGKMREHYFITSWFHEVGRAAVAKVCVHLNKQTCDICLSGSRYLDVKVIE